MNFPFDPLNPFPLLSAGQDIPYALQKEHAEKADLHFGFRIREVEAELTRAVTADVQKAQWVGLDPASLQTPYTELRWMLSVLHLKPGDTVADLGAGYGRMGLVIHKHHPDCNFVGVEIARARADEGNRIFRNWGAARARIFHADAGMPTFELPRAEIYFIYDLSVPETIRRVIERLKLRARTSPLCVVGRGRATRDQIERNEPWLSQVNPPRHFGNFTIYTSA